MDPLLTCSSPFKGEAGRGMGFLAGRNATHPHPCLPAGRLTLPLKGREYIVSTLYLKGSESINSSYVCPQ